MTNYYIYEILYITYQIPDKMDSEQIYVLVAGNGDWNEEYHFTNELVAKEQWEKCKLWAETDLDYDYDGDEYFYSRIMVFTDGESIIDYSVIPWRGLF